MLSADILSRLAALRLPSKAMAEVLSILADAQAGEERRAAEAEGKRAKDRERKARGRSTEIPRNSDGHSTEVPADNPSPKKEPPPHPQEKIPLPPKENPLRGQKKGLASETFDRFKAAYPKRAGSNPWEPARQKFERAMLDGADPEQIIAAASRYASEQQKLGKIGTEFIAQAVTWLNQKCWQDYAAQDVFEGITVKRYDPRWAFLVARWERENSREFPRLANEWPFPEAWLTDANAKPKAELECPAFLLRQPERKAG